MEITNNDFAEMIYHWLDTPVYGYLGTDYGSDPKSLLQQPNNVGLADNFIAKLKRDIPILNEMDVQVYLMPLDEDKSALVISLNNQMVASYPREIGRKPNRAYST